jgi:hypothetical protein
MEKPIGGIVGNDLMLTGCMCPRYAGQDCGEPIAHTLAAASSRTATASQDRILVTASNAMPRGLLFTSALCACSSTSPRRAAKTGRRD